MVRVLSQCHQLHWMNLGGNKISTGATKALADLLPKSYIQYKNLIWGILEGGNLVGQKLIDPVIDNNLIQRQRAEMVVKSFYHDKALTRLFFDQNNIISKQDLMDFRFWEKNNDFWFDSISTNNQKVKRILSKRINDYINENYLQITRIVKNVSNMKRNNNNIMESSLCDLPVEVLGKIFSYVQLQDVNNF